MSIPIPVGRALSESVTGRLGYVHFDAHIDCQPNFAGEDFTNWSHVARMIELPNVDPRNVAIIGARGALNPPEQWDFVERHGIRVFRMREVTRRGIEAVVREALDIIELIPAYDHPAMISLRLAGYMILHVLGGWAREGEQVA
jgi:arginase family enzyme